MQPEASGKGGDGADGGTLWFSSSPLERSVLESLLTRVLLVRDVYQENRPDDEAEEEGGDVDKGEQKDMEVARD